METVFEKREDIDINTIKSVGDFAMKLAKIGGIDPKPLKELSHSFGDEQEFRNSKIEFGLVTTCLKPFKKIEKFVDEMEEGKVIDYILASTACYPIMQKYTIDGVEYVDGGYTDNLPFDMALRRGATELVIVDMHGMFRINKPEDVNVKVYYISPTRDLGNFMIFDQEQSRKNIKLGYLDTLKIFGELEGKFYTFESGTVARTNEYNEICKSVYKRVFTDLPKVSPLEKLAHRSFYKYLNDYNIDVFDTANNVLDILEIAATIYDISPYEIYSFEELLEKVVEEYSKICESDDYIKRMSIKEIRKSVTSFAELKKIVTSYDKKELTAYIVYLLSLEKINMTQKNQILAITSIWPECLCAAIIIVKAKMLE